MGINFFKTFNIFFIFAILLNCSNNKIYSQKIEIDSLYVFSNNILTDSFSLVYDNKAYIKEKRLKSIFDDMPYHEFLKYVRNKDSIIVHLLSEFDNDTVSVFYNSELVYYNEKLKTQLSIDFSDDCIIRKGNKKNNYLGFKINKKKIYWALVDPEYLYIDINYLQGKIYIEFHNQFLIFD